MVQFAGTHTTAMGPFDRWPTGHGFDYFYGFVAGETSQWEPRLYENMNPVEPPVDEKCHLSEDLADKAVAWLRKHESFAPDKPFFLYWASGAAHGPHHIFKEWVDKYKGKFDDGWDRYRERVFASQRATGWIPADAALTPRADTMQGWDRIPEAERPFQRRLMEVFAGFLEYVDAQVGRILDELDRLGKSDNTIVIHIFGDNGSSAEGQKGSISELLAQNYIPNTVEEQIGALEKLGGLEVLGTPKTDNMYHAGWAWAGNTPFHYTKLVASHFGGTRNPLAIAWPRRIRPDGKMRGQFHHVTDIVPTLYDVLGIPLPKGVDGHAQKPMDGVSMAYTFDRPEAPTHTRTMPAAASTRKAGTPVHLVRSSRGTRRALRSDWQIGTRAKRTGNSTTSIRTSLRPTISRRLTPRSWRSLKNSSLKNSSKRSHATIWFGRSVRAYGFVYIPRTASSHRTPSGASMARLRACRNLLPWLGAAK